MFDKEKKWEKKKEAKTKQQQQQTTSLGAGEVDRGGEGINELKREIRKIGPERLRKKRAREGNHG